jgi:hypothetical protein
MLYDTRIWGRLLRAKWDAEKNLRQAGPFMMPVRAPRVQARDRSFNTTPRVASYGGLALVFRFCEVADPELPDCGNGTGTKKFHPVR